MQFFESIFYLQSDPEWYVIVAQLIMPVLTFMAVWVALRAIGAARRDTVAAIEAADRRQLQSEVYRELRGRFLSLLESIGTYRYSYLEDANRVLTANGEAKERERIYQEVSGDATFLRYTILYDSLWSELVVAETVANQYKKDEVAGSRIRNLLAKLEASLRAAPAQIWDVHDGLDEALSGEFDDKYLKNLGDKITLFYKSTGAARDTIISDFREVLSCKLEDGLIEDPRPDPAVRRRRRQKRERNDTTEQKE